MYAYMICIYIYVCIYIYIHTHVWERRAKSWSAFAKAGLREAARLEKRRSESSFRKHNSTRKREYPRIMLPLMSQVWFRMLGWG